MAQRSNGPRLTCRVYSSYFIEQKIPDKIIKMLHSNNIPPECLEVELTESVLAESSVNAIISMAHSMGMKVVAEKHLNNLIYCAA